MTYESKKYPNDDPDVVSALLREAESFGVESSEQRSMPTKVFSRKVIDIALPELNNDESIEE